MKYGGFRNCPSFVTYEAKAMTGTVRGLAVLLKQNYYDSPYQEALFGKSLRLMNAIKVLVRISNLPKDGNRGH